jgi:regulator of nonsense transcripts 1
MRTSMLKFAREELCMSQYIYQKLLGHNVDDVVFNRPNLPKKLNAPNLPELNPSQIGAVKTVLSRPLSLIQVIEKRKQNKSVQFDCVRVHQEQEKQ